MREIPIWVKEQKVRKPKDLDVGGWLLSADPHGGKHPTPSQLRKMMAWMKKYQSYVESEGRSK